MAKVSPRYHPGVAGGASQAASARERRPVEGGPAGAVCPRFHVRGINHCGTCAVFARGIPSQLEENVVERRAAQGKMAGGDAFIAQRRCSCRHQLNTIAAGRHRELVRALGGLRISATYRG